MSHAPSNRAFGNGEKNNALACCEGGPCMAREGCVNPLVARGPHREKMLAFDSGATRNRKETILEEADRLVSDDRREDYGHPLDDFGRVTRMAHALWGRGPETEEEHAMYMILVKLARETNRPKRDNRVDIAGYAKTLDLVIEERKSRFL